MFDHPTLNKGLLIRENIRDLNRELTLLADARKIRQVLTNFVSNALKYTFDGFIELGYHFQKNVIEFFVRDTGMGVSKREQQLIFDTFYRGEEAINAAIRGTGLGLNIAREIVDLMDGEIGVESELNLGSRFYFRIPVEIDVSEEEPVQLYEIGPDLKEISVLIVDDEEFNSRYLEVLLHNRVKNIDLARNGQEAVDMAFTKDYQMIFMDLKMPVMDGLEATRIIKSKFPRLPVIAQTACVLPEDKEVAMKAGCDGILYKPIEKEKILEVIHKFVDRQIRPF